MHFMAHRAILAAHIQCAVMSSIRYKCPSTGAYIRPAPPSGGLSLPPSIEQARGLTAERGIVVESGDPMLSPGDILHHNRGQHHQVGEGIFFIRSLDMFAVSRGGAVEPLPDRTGRGSLASFIPTPFKEVLWSPHGKPLHHLLVQPEDVRGIGGLEMPAAAAAYSPRDNFSGDLRPRCGVVLESPVMPIDRMGVPYKGRVPQPGDTVWWGTISWAGGLWTDDKHGPSGRIERLPGLIGLGDIHLCTTPSGEMFAVGDFGIATQEDAVGGFSEGRRIIGEGRFMMGGDQFVADHGDIHPGTMVAFRTFGWHNTVAPAPWGWCVKIGSQNLTGIERSGA